MDNLLLLQNANIENILLNLKDRYEKNNIYTYAGKILIAVNPFQVTELYSNEIKNKFLERNISIPHLYELANDAIKVDEKKIAFLISGESGSGKTESTKKILEYLELNYKDINGIMGKILEFNCILEAFGNATTIRNHNSSRFGKFIKINVNGKEEISARIKTYLLEKIRVVSDKLCNYHIFYEYGYKNCRPDYLDNPRKDWDNNYLKKENLKNIWIKNGLNIHLWNEIESIIILIIGLLDNKINKDFLLNYAYLTIEDYNNLVSYKTIHTGEEIIKTELSVMESKTVIQTIAMTLYDKLFEKIVGLINESMGEENGECKKSFGILDIFGFEVFTKNGFEQLCINYTNERLQSIFNKYVFEEEIKMFEEEGILKERITFETNGHIIDFFDKKQNGFFPLLDEKSILNANDGDLERTIPKNDKVIKFKLGSFVIKHYAENVEYNWGDFSLKNIERANSDILDFLNKIYKNNNIFSSLIKKNNKRGSIGNLTITNQFRSSLNALVDELDSSQLYFIRCLKPNEDNEACKWEEEKIINQLNYCGIISALELARQSFPVRMLKMDFIKKYEPIYLKEGLYWEEWLERIDEGDFLLGNTRVFYTKDMQNKLNSLLIDAQKKLIERLLYTLKMKCDRIKYEKKRGSVNIISRSYKGHVGKMQLRLMKSEVVIVLSVIRYFDRREIVRMKNLVNKLERAIIERKIRKKSRKKICLRVIVWIIRRRYVKDVMEERESLEGLIQMRVDLAKFELDKFYRERIEILDKRVKELEKYEGLYNDLSGLIQNNESMMISRMSKNKSEDNLPLIGIMEESEFGSNLIKSNIGNGIFDWENEKYEYMNAIQNLTKRVNFEFERFQEVNKYYEELQFDYQKYKVDIKEAQILMSEKMYRMHNENIMLKEENIRLTREFNRNYGKSWIQKLFM